MSSIPHGENPYVYRHYNMIVARTQGTKGRPECFSLYEVYQSHDDFQSGDAFEEELLWLDGVLSNLMRAGQFALIPVKANPETQLRADEKYVPEGLQKLFDHTLDQTLDHLHQNPFEYRVYLALNVKEKSGNPFKDIIQIVMESYRDPARKLESALGGRPYNLAGTHWTRFQREERETFLKLERALGGRVRKLSFEEVGMLLERYAAPGVYMEPKSGVVEVDEVEVVEGATVLTTSPAEMVPAYEDVVHDPSTPGIIQYKKVIPEGIHEGYFCYLVIGRLPDGYAEYPYTTALFKICQEKFSFPVELNISFNPRTWDFLRWQLNTLNWLSNYHKKTKEKSNKQMDKRASTVSKEQQSLIDEVAETKIAKIFETQITIRVWGKTPQEVYDRRTEVKETLKGYQVIIPSMLQKHLFYSTLPGNPRKMGYQYFIKPTSQWLAATAPLSGIHLGDHEGYQVGYTGPSYEDKFTYRIPVMLNPRKGSRSQKRAKSPAMINYGAPGGGKSVLANWILFNEVLRGAKALIFDPKNERWAWPFEIPELAPYINIVTLREGMSDKGKLDPLLRIQGDSSDVSAKQSAKRILWYLTDYDDNTYGGIAISQAIEAVVNDYLKRIGTDEEKLYRPCMRKVLNILEKYLDGDDRNFNFPKKEHVREQAEREISLIVTKLRNVSVSGLAMLLFAEGHEEPLDLTKPLTILQIQGLVKSDKEEAPDKKQNDAVTMGVCDLATEFVSQKAAARVVLFEELHEFSETEQLRIMIRSMIRKGRSMGNIIQLVTHNNRDLNLDKDSTDDGGGEVRSNLGVRFVYRVGDKEEARKACEILGIPATEENLDLLSNDLKMESGDFLMRDLDGRVGMVRFPLDEINPQLYQAFRTDTDAQELREEKYGEWKYRNYSYQAHLVWEKEKLVVPS